MAARLVPWATAASIPAAAIVLITFPVVAAEPNKPVTLAVAKDRAEVMHEQYAETLEVIHYRYFRREGASCPRTGGRIRPR